MSHLLDTHVLIWWLLDDKRLSRLVRGVLQDPSQKVLVSSASAWEIATKHRLGKLKGVDALARDISGWIQRAGFEELPVGVAHAQRAGSWPSKHRDPFDRMLAAQSVLDGIPLVSADEAFESFGVTVVW